MGEDGQWTGRIGLTGLTGGGPLLGAVERLPQQDRLRRRGQVLLCPDDVRDGHLSVVHHHGEHEERLAVRARHDEVLDRLVGELDIAADDVVDDGDAVVGDGETERPSRSPIETAVAAVTVVARDRVVLRPRPDLLLCAVTGVQVAGVKEHVEGGGVEPSPLRLPVRPLVPVDLEPAEGLEDAGVLALLVPLTVGVLDPQDERPAVAAGDDTSCRAPSGRSRHGSSRSGMARS